MDFASTVPIRVFDSRKAFSSFSYLIKTVFDTACWCSFTTIQESVRPFIDKNLYTYYKCENYFFCVCIIKLHCHFLPDLAQILNKAMNSKGAASKPVPGADFIQLLILRHLFVSHTQN